MGVDPIKIELHNFQFVGDLLCMTAAVRDMAAVRRCTECLFEGVLPQHAKKKAIDCPACGRRSTLRRKFMIRAVTEGDDPRHFHLWDHNPYLDDFSEPSMILKIGTGTTTKQSNSSTRHMCEAYRVSIMQQTGFDFPQGESIPDLHLSDHEKAMPPIIDGRYWLICLGKRPPYTSKYWPPENWQTVVDALPHITFVQIGHSAHYHPELQGENVINMVGQTQDPQTGSRDWFRLVHHADGVLTLVSSLMHLAAAFRKPAVVVAAGREPVPLEMYPFHVFLQNVGAMSCEGEDASGRHRSHKGTKACWKASAEACPNLIGEYPKCITMIKPEQVIEGVNSYYEGGQLLPITGPAKRKATKMPVFKMICNAHAWGGGERSAAWLMNRMLLEGYDVQLRPTGGIGGQFRKALSRYVKVVEKAITPCDILAVYSNDMIWGFKDKFLPLERAEARRKVMILNFRLGDAGETDWTKTWDRYIFLCSEMEQEFIERVPDSDTLILPPPVDLTEFLDMDLGSLNKTLHIVRVGSQSSQKMPPNIGEFVKTIKSNVPTARFTFMGGHPTLADIPDVECHEEYSKPVMDILRRGTVFWYMLPYQDANGKPKRYRDNGPRVIMEAMGSGLPIVADNWGGAADRVTEETGWLPNTPAEHIEVLSNLTGKELSAKGRAAKERARNEFDPELWVKAIVGD